LGANGSSLNVNAGYVVNDGNSGGNYTVTLNSATGTITPAALTIRADDKSRDHGTANPPFTATYIGLQAGDAPSSLSGLLAFTTPATITAPPGTYAITPLGQSSSDYAITYVNGILAVAPVLPPLRVFGPLIQAANFNIADPKALAYGTGGTIAAAGTTADLLNGLPATAAGPAEVEDGDLRVEKAVDSDPGTEPIRRACFTPEPLTAVNCFKKY
jgi:hypothetical protein